MRTVFLPGPPYLSSAHHRTHGIGNNVLRVGDASRSGRMFSLNQNVCCFLGYCFFQLFRHYGRFCKKEITSVKKIPFQSSILTSCGFVVCGLGLWT